MPFHHVLQTLPMSSTLTAPHPISTSCPQDDVSLLASHALPPPTAPLLIPPANNPTSLPFPPSVATSPLTPHISPTSAPNIPVGLTTATTTTTRSGTSALPSPSKWRVSPSQREILQAAFDINPYPELKRKAQLAGELGVTTTQVSKWFQHRRETLTRLGQFKAQYNRTRRTPEQLNILQQAFTVDRYPSAERLAQLESQLEGVTAKQIKLWFKHRRKQALKPKRPKSSSASLTLGSSSRSSFDSSGNRGHLPKSPQCHPSSQSSYPTAFPTDNQQQHHSLHNPVHAISESQGPTAPSSFGSTIPSQMPTQHLSDSNSAYPMDSNPNYYGFKRQSIPVVSTPLSSGATTGTTVPSSGTPTHSPNIDKSPFSGMEEMALRAAHVVTDGKPSADGVSRLSRFLNRTQSDVSQWFSVGSDTNADMGSNEYMNSSCPQSDGPLNYSPRQMQHSPSEYRKSEPAPGVSQNQNISSLPDSSQENHGQNTNQSIQNPVGEFSKHDSNASSSNNDASHQHQTEKSSYNGKVSNGVEAEQSKSNLENGLNDSAITSSKTDVNSNEVSGAVGCSPSNEGSVASKSFHRVDEERKAHHPSSQQHHGTASTNPSNHIAPVQPISQGMMNHNRHQQVVHSQHQQSMYGNYMCSNESAMVVGGQQAGVSSNLTGGQGSPMLAPLRYSGESPVSASYMAPTGGNAWYQQAHSYK